MFPCAINKDQWLEPLAAFHGTSFAKPRGQNWAWLRILLAVGGVGMGGEDFLGRVRQRDPEGRASVQRFLLLILRPAQHISPRLPIATPGAWGWGGKGRGAPWPRGPSGLSPARHPPSVRGQHASVLISHFPEVSRLKGRGGLLPGFPNPPVSNSICITPLPSTWFWHLLQQHLLPKVCPTQASPSSDDKGQEVKLASSFLSCQLTAWGPRVWHFSRQTSREPSRRQSRRWDGSAETSSPPPPSRTTPG